MVIARRERPTDVAVSDVEAACRFYGGAFAAAPVQADEDVGSAADPQARYLRLANGTVLRVFDERASSPTRDRTEKYEKGRTPRMEFRVDDVDAWVDRAARLGSKVLFRLARRSDRALHAAVPGGEPVAYAHIVDPFGHLWAFARAEEERV